MAVPQTEVETFESFLAELQRRPSIRMVKLADFGFAGEVRTSTGAHVLIPQLRVIATAFDKADGTLFRWESIRQRDTGKSAAFQTIKTRHGDIRVVLDKKDLRALLELDGYLVSDGQWTPEDVERLLALRQTVP